MHKTKKDIDTCKVKAFDADAVAEIFAEIALDAGVAVMEVYAGDSRVARSLRWHDDSAIDKTRTESFHCGGLLRPP